MRPRTYGERRDLRLLKEERAKVKKLERRLANRGLLLTAATKEQRKVEKRLTRFARSIADSLDSAVPLLLETYGLYGNAKFKNAAKTFKAWAKKCRAQCS